MTGQETVGTNSNTGASSKTSGHTETLLAVRITEHWHELTRELTVESLLKNCLEKVLSN